jgi:hypothetical protein
MRKNLSRIFVAVAAMAWMTISAQSQVIQPEVISNFDNEKLVMNALEGEKQGGMSMNAVWVNKQIDMNTMGTWEYNADGSSRWIYSFQSPGALALGVVFSYYNLPEGAELYFYSADKSWLEGPFTAAQNHNHHIYRTPEVYGDAAVLEYRQPAGVVGNVKLETRGILHFFRMVEDPRAEQFKNVESDPCEVDINCPEGDAWANEKHAVVRLSLIMTGGAGLCSGTLVNNTAMDCKGYVLTAMHCTESSSASDLLSSSARFNFAKSGCGTGLGSSTQNSVGLYLRADSNDGGGTTGSDFALIELQDAIPASWTVYYAGWDATDNVPAAIQDSLYGAKAVCIHHPAGDYMKISHAGTLAKGTWQASDRHWRVVWQQTETNWGVTEGGSSGSPIFSPSHQIIGTLTGGGSYCTAQTAADYYGRVAKHWTGNFNPNTADQKLKVWLDPGNLGWLTMNGASKGTSALPCQPVDVKEELQFNDVVVYPTLIDNSFQVSVTNNPWIQTAVVFDSNGREVASQKFTSGKLVFETNSWADGIYYLSVRQNNGSYITKKLVVAHS